MSEAQESFASTPGKFLACDAVHRVIGIPILSDTISISPVLQGIRQGSQALEKLEQTGNTRAPAPVDVASIEEKEKIFIAITKGMC